MSKQQNTPNKSQQLSAAYGSGPSRLVRTNPSNPQNRPANNSTASEIIPTEIERNLFSQLPNKVSALDKNIIFQDMDKKRDANNKSTNPSSINHSISSNPNPVEANKAIGLISNVFIGATNKFMKGGASTSTPIKNNEQAEEEVQDTIKVTPAKFSRNKEVVETKTRTISMREPANQPEGLNTDRSQAEGGKKIERRQVAGGGRELKFVEKKQEKIESTPEKITFKGAIITNKIQIQTKIQTVVKEEESYPRLYQQPVQRPNPYGRSRIITEQVTKQQQPDPVKQRSIEKSPKEQVKPTPPPNRLVASRLQANLSQSKTAEKEIVSKPVTNRTSNSKLVVVSSAIETEPAHTESRQQVQAKEEVKPKPYSRSFVAKKVTTEIVQTPSTIIQPSTNPSTISQSSFIKTSESKRVEQKVKSESKENTEKQLIVILKKSSCIALICRRLITSRVSDAFSILKNHKQSTKLRCVNQCLILGYSIANIIRIKESSGVRFAFESIKRKFTGPYIASLKSYADAPPLNHRSISINLLDRIYSSKVREVFKVLKNPSERFKNISKCVVILDTITRRRELNAFRSSFQAIRLRKQQRIYSMNQLSVISNNVNKNKLAIAFLKIAAVKPAPTAKVETSASKQRPRIASKIEEVPNTPPPNNQALIEKLDKLKKSSVTVNDELSSIQSNIQRKKKSVDSEKQNLVERVTVLKHQNEQVNNEIEIRKHRNDQIKKEMENIVPKNIQILEEELPEPRDNRLEILTNIYISNFKNSQESISTEEIINSYNLIAQDSSVLFHEWQSILRNVQLKRLIAAYEGVDPKQNKGRANLIGQQGLISKLIRSYVKEQYFWNWIHISAQNI